MPGGVDGGIWGSTMLPGCLLRCTLVNGGVAIDPACVGCMPGSPSVAAVVARVRASANTWLEIQAVPVTHTGGAEALEIQAVESSLENGHRRLADTRKPLTPSLNHHFTRLCILPVL